MTQTFIFVNTLNFADIVHQRLRKENLASYIMFSKMSPKERDETMKRFRAGEINVLITTNLIARGIDVPEADLVINFDVPALRINGKSVGDLETYQHRVGRCGRFGQQGIALTLWDRGIDKENLDSIISQYNNEMKIEELQGKDHLQLLLEEIREKRRDCIQ